MLDQMYAISPSELNSFIFSSESNYLKQSVEVQGSIDLQVGPWKIDTESSSLKRVVTYIKAPSRLIKAIKAVEDQKYLKADGKSFAVLASVNTPEAPYASNYRVEVMTSISQGHELPSSEESSHLVVSWQMNFLHNTMMKGMIEGGARQGVKDSFEQVGGLLVEKLKVVDLKDFGSEKEQVLASCGDARLRSILDEEEVLRFCQKNMAAFEVPKKVLNIDSKEGDMEDQEEDCISTATVSEFGA